MFIYLFTYILKFYIAISIYIYIYIVDFLCYWSVRNFMIYKVGS